MTARGIRMFNYPTYYNEWNGPQAGIDTISIYIYPYLINKHSYFHEQGNANEAINLRRKTERDYLTKKIYRTDYLMDIQAEAINPNLNIFHQILELIVKLFQADILSFSTKPHEELIYYFLVYNFDRLFAIDYVDFYFDIKEEEAILLGNIDNRYPNTQYSSDNCIKTYNRISRLKCKNTISHKKIENIVYPRRIEFHLTRKTCRYLNCMNLNGTYDMVFQYYLHFFVRKWRKYRHQLISIPNIKESDYHYLKQIDILAFAMTIPHNMALAKSPLKPVPYKKAKKNEIGNNWLPRFVTGKSMSKIQG
jgi:hypothetical protein